MDEYKDFDPKMERVAALKYWHKDTSRRFYEAVIGGDKVFAVGILPKLLSDSFDRVLSETESKPHDRESENASHVFFSLLGPLPNAFDILEKKSSPLEDVELEQIRSSLEELATLVIEKFPKQLAFLSNEWKTSTKMDRGGVVNLREMLRDDSDEGMYNPFESVKDKDG